MENISKKTNELYKKVCEVGVDILKLLEKPQEYTTVVFKGEVNVTEKVVLNGNREKVVSVCYGDAISKLSKLEKKKVPRRKRLNHVAKKVIEVFRASGVSDDKVSKIEKTIEKHKDKYQTLAWCECLSEKKREHLAKLLDINPIELSICLRLMKEKI